MLRRILGAGVLLAAFAAAVYLFALPAGATYKPEFAIHSPALKKWFQEAVPTAEARARFRWPVNWGCCEQSERVHARFRPGARGDEWYFQCNGETLELCRSLEHSAGDWVQIPPDIIHEDPIAVPAPYSEDDPQVREEFQQLRAEGVLFIAWSTKMTCFWKPQSGQ